MRIFVAYPYRLEGYRETLRGTLEDTDIELLFADERLVNNHVLRKIESMIKESDLAIFDVTGANPNVTLELGIAVATDHPYIVVVNKTAVAELNADIHGWDQLRYDDVTELGEKLKDFIARESVPVKHGRVSDEPSPPELTETSPLHGHFPIVTLQPQATNPDWIIGCELFPKLYRPDFRSFDSDDDGAFKAIEAQSVGLSGSVHPQLSDEPKFEGILFASPRPDGKRSDGAPLQPAFQIFVRADGIVTVRFDQTEDHPLFQVYRVLAVGQLFSREIVKRLNLPSQMTVRVRATLHAGRMKQKPTLPGFYDNANEVDVAQPFAPAFIEAALRILRAGGTSVSRKEIADSMLAFATREFPQLIAAHEASA